VRLGDLNSPNVLVQREGRNGWDLCCIETGPAKSCVCCRAGYWIASVQSAEHDFTALYKAAWPSAGRLMSMACPVSLSTLLHRFQYHFTKLYELVPVTV